MIDCQALKITEPPIAKNMANIELRRMIAPQKHPKYYFPRQWKSALSWCRKLLRLYAMWIRGKDLHAHELINLKCPSLIWNVLTTSLQYCK